jgi:two-component sensor histidine kinase
MRLTHHPRWQRLSIAPLAILVAFVLRLLLIPLTGYAGPFLLFFSAVMLSAWVGQLSTQLLRIYGVAPEQVTVSLAAEEVWLSLDQAIPCGLIINELFSNSLKYAFPDGQPGTIGIALHAASPGMLTLKVWDTGVGLPRDVPPPAHTSLGMTLVHDLVRQLRGTLVTENGAGTAVTITFPQRSVAGPIIAEERGGQ